MTKRKAVPRAEQALRCIARLNARQAAWTQADLAREMGASRSTAKAAIGALLEQGRIEMKVVWVQARVPVEVKS